MSEFDYLAVFISIIFGISLTRILEGAISTIHRKKAEENQLVWTLFMFFVMTLNWWTGYAWHHQKVWDLDLFLIIIIWAIAHYLSSIALYPPEMVGGGERSFKDRRNWFYVAFIGVTLTDILQTAARGDAFSPIYYLPFVLHFALLALIAIFVQKPRFHRWLGWYFLTAMFIWALVVRRFVV